MGGVSWVMWCLRRFFYRLEIVIYRGNNPEVNWRVCLEASFACAMLEAMSGCLKSSVSCIRWDPRKVGGGRNVVGSAI